MSLIAPIALTGITAGLKRLHVSADNVSRRHVANSEKNQVILSENAHGGVTTDVTKVPLDPELKTTDDAPFDLSMLTSSNIDYAEETVEQMIASYATKASLSVYKTASEMDKELLNIKT